MADEKSKILVVEDEQTLVETLDYSLRRQGYDVLTAMNGRAALELARKHMPDLVVLDIMLPGLDGFEICRILRQETSVPILMLTARTEEIDKIVGLEVGADDYLTKPFSPRELVARVRTVLRRAGGSPTIEVIRAGTLTLDRARYKVQLPDREVTLTPTEFEILAALAAQPGRVFSRGQLLSAARGVAFESYERAIDSHIRNLRRKIEPPEDEPQYILTVHGLGYKFAE
jgi:DNA-binding response OmpR family regulator